MKYLKKILTIIFLLPLVSAAQDPHISQYHYTPLLINPAQAGLKSEIQADFLYRRQWASIGVPFATPSVSFIYPFVEANSSQNRLGGAGISFINDRSGEEGIFSTTAILGALAYNMNLNEKLDFLKNAAATHYISIGLEGGYLQKRLNYDLLRSGSQWQNGGYDPTLPLGENQDLNKRGMADLSAGIMWYRVRKIFYDGNSQDETDAYGGLSFNHLNRPDEAIYFEEKAQFPMRFSAMGGFNIYANQFIISPQLLYMRQAKINELNVGSYLRYKLNYENDHFLNDVTLGVGAFYRANDAGIIATEIQYENWKAGIAYDINISGLSSSTSGKGAFEIGLSWSAPVEGYINLPWKKQKASRKPMISPALAKPQPEKIRQITIRGEFTNETGEKIEAAEIKIYNKSGDKFIAKTITDENGNYEITLPPGEGYLLIAAKKDYLPAEKEIEAPGKDENELEVNLQAQKAEMGQKIVLENVHFETDKVVLKSESYQQLDRIAEYLQSSPDKKIEISGHTDNVGNDEYNKDLSQRRAQAVVDYLISKGIPKSQLEAKGYGESEPIATNETEEGRAKNRRVEFKVLK